MDQRLSLNAGIVNPVAICGDNCGMAKNPKSKKAKHIELKYHFNRNLVASGLLNVESIDTCKLAGSNS